MIAIGDCTLIHGDSIDILPTLSECADMVLTDPPYELTSGGGIPKNGQNRMSGCFNTKEYINDGKIVTCDIDWCDFMPLLYNCLRGDSHAYVMCNNRHVQAMLMEAERAEFHFHNLLVWDKGTATPNRWYMKNLEFTGFFKKGKAKFINDCGSKQLVKVKQENYGTHPTTKPVALMEHYILNSSNVGDTIIDPFMGVGATAIACINTGRKFIGIELDKDYYVQAVHRVESHKPQMSMGI